MSTFPSRVASAQSGWTTRWISGGGRTGQRNAHRSMTSPTPGVSTFPVDETHGQGRCCS
jgi:hypothetical protein